MRNAEPDVAKECIGIHFQLSVKPDSFGLLAYKYNMLVDFQGTENNVW